MSPRTPTAPDPLATLLELSLGRVGPSLVPLVDVGALAVDLSPAPGPVVVTVTLTPAIGVPLAEGLADSAHLHKFLVVWAALPETFQAELVAEVAGVVRAEAWSRRVSWS